MYHQNYIVDRLDLLFSPRIFLTQWRNDQAGFAWLHALDNGQLTSELNASNLHRPYWHKTKLSILFIDN